MKYYFLTGNKHKFMQVSKVMHELGIELEQVNIDKPELQADTLEEVARYSAEYVANKQKKAIMVEDTGIFFTAFENFPGVYTKFIVQQIGYEGIMKILKGKNREAYFKTVAAFAAPGKKARLFSATTKGSIATQVFCKDADVMPYDRIFIPKGSKEPWCKITGHTNYVSHRKHAFRKLAAHLKKKSC